MAQRNKRRGHPISGAAAGLTGAVAGSSLPGNGLHGSGLHSVETHSHPGRDSGSIWNRRRVLLLNSTYEPLTALPVRRAISMASSGPLSAQMRPRKAR